MTSIFKLNYVLIILFLMLGCGKSLKKEKVAKLPNEKDSIESIFKKSIRKQPNKEINKSHIDKESNNEIFGGDGYSEKEIYSYFRKEVEDEIEIWSEKMFGRCCTEADLSYSEVLYFNIATNINNLEYPIDNISDKKYLTSFVFKENDSIKIDLSLNISSSYFDEDFYPKLSPQKVLKDTDSLMYPFKLSLVNGYVKSKDLFLKNSRVKEMDFFLNDTYVVTVSLLDTPLVQEFEVDILFTKNDKITLKPTSFYRGSKYDDVCISEIQTSLSKITHFSINKKYNVYELNK